MKRFLLALAFAAMTPAAFAGLTYRVESVSTGLREGTLNAEVEAEGDQVRMNITRGDGAMFMDGSIVLSQNGGRAVTVFDPSTKTYFEMQLDQLFASMGSMLNQMGGMMKLSIVDPKVSVRDLGAGETIEGYPTHRTAIDTSCTVAIDAMGEKMSIPVTTTVESWTTDNIRTNAASFLQTQSFHTGIEDVDKLIALQAGASAKGFPLKVLMTTKIAQNGSAIESKSTTRVTDIVKKQIPASDFAAPSGYTKTENPMEKMVRAMSGRAQ